MTTILSLKTDRFSGKCDDCVYPIVRTLPEIHGDFARVHCPSCNKQIKVARLYGQYKDHNCDARCQFAASPICMCACGGANHMKGYLPLVPNGEITADLLSKYRRSVANRQAGVEKRAAKKQASKAEKLAAAKEAALLNVSERVRPLLSFDFDLSTTDMLDDYGKNVVMDIRLRFQQFAFITDRQGAFIEKLLDQQVARVARQVQQNAEIKVAAPVGRQVIQGVVVARKEFENEWGFGHRLTIKITEEDGIWLVNCTEPSKFRCERGDVVRGTVTLERSDKPEFAFGSRPSKFEKLGRQEDFYDAGESSLD